MKKIKDFNDAAGKKFILGLAQSGDVYRLYKGKDGYTWDEFESPSVPFVFEKPLSLEDAIGNALTLGYDVWTADSVEELIEVLRK